MKSDSRISVVINIEPGSSMLFKFFKHVVPDRDIFLIG
jgi:hypothetical protein